MRRWDLLCATRPSEASTTVALFLVDENGNGATDGTAISRFSVVPFLKGVDVFMPSVGSESLEVSLNGDALHIPRWRSDSDGISLVLLD